MRKRHFKIILSLLIGLLVLIGLDTAIDKIVVTDSEQQVIYNEAKARCTNEMWPVYEDIGPVMMPDPLKPPYPESYKEAVHGIPHGYGCTRQEAQAIR